MLRKIKNLAIITRRDNFVCNFLLTIIYIVSYLHLKSNFQNSILVYRKELCYRNNLYYRFCFTILNKNDDLFFSRFDIGKLCRNRKLRQQIKTQYVVKNMFLTFNFIIHC